MRAPETDRRVRVGVVGCGVVASAYYLPYLRRYADLVAVCDLGETRARECARLFGAKTYYTDYAEMLAKADIEAVFILTGPGTHVPFTLAAVESGRHVLVQKPMATDLADARRIATAVRQAGVKALVEPSSASPLDPRYPPLRRLVRQGVLGRPATFTAVSGAPDSYGRGLGANPYGVGAFFSKDSGGMVFDFPYGPSEVVALLGSVRTVTAVTATVSPEVSIVPDEEYDAFLREANDPDDANYWPVVLEHPRTQRVRTEAADTAFSLYELANGAIGVIHVGRHLHPAPPGHKPRGLEIYGTEGNLFRGGGFFASILSTRDDLLPELDAEGWYRVPLPVTGSAPWPVPPPGTFHYYHESTKHLLECIVRDEDPVVNVEWGLHITELMYATVESARTGERYELTTSLPDDW